MRDHLLGGLPVRGEGAALLLTLAHRCHPGEGDPARDLGVLVARVRDRLARVHHLTFLTRWAGEGGEEVSRTVPDILTSHLEGRRRGEGACSHPTSREEEVQYLRQVAGVLAVHLLPPHYTSTKVPPLPTPGGR